MKPLAVRGILLDVQYYEELEPYVDQFDRFQIRDNKIQACSPYRSDQHPSFAVNLDNGSWVDSGADTEEDRKGNFTSLLCFFRKESYSDTADYLLEKYSHIYYDVAGLKLQLNLIMDAGVPLLLPKWEKYQYGACEYLTGRKISAEIQDYFSTGLSAKGDAVVIPWHDRQGRVINIKYRMLADKTFFYSKGGKPVKNYLYGGFAVAEHKCKTVAITESEIDTLYLWTLGIPAVAVGGSSLSFNQQQELLLLGVEHLIIATDMDAVGHRLAGNLYDRLCGYMQISRLELPAGKKDVNECTNKEIKTSYSNITNMLKCFTVF